MDSAATSELSEEEKEYAFITENPDPGVPKSLFLSYANFNEDEKTGKISIGNTIMWLQQAKLIEGDHQIFEEEVEEAFKDVAKNKERLGRQEFQQVISVLAEKKGIDEAILLENLMHSSCREKFLPERTVSRILKSRPTGEDSLDVIKLRFRSSNITEMFGITDQDIEKAYDEVEKRRSHVRRNKLQQVISVLARQKNLAETDLHQRIYYAANCNKDTTYQDKRPSFSEPGDYGDKDRLELLFKTFALINNNKVSLETMKDWLEQADILKEEKDISGDDVSQCYEKIAENSPFISEFQIHQVISVLIQKKKLNDYKVIEALIGGTIQKIEEVNNILKDVKECREKKLDGKDEGSISMFKSYSAMKYDKLDVEDSKELLRQANLFYPGYNVSDADVEYVHQKISESKPAIDGTQLGKLVEALAEKNDLDTAEMTEKLKEAQLNKMDELTEKMNELKKGYHRKNSEKKNSNARKIPKQSEPAIIKPQESLNQSFFKFRGKDAKLSLQGLEEWLKQAKLLHSDYNISEEDLANAYNKVTTDSSGVDQTQLEQVIKVLANTKSLKESDLYDKLAQVYDEDYRHSTFLRDTISVDAQDKWRTKEKEYLDLFDKYSNLEDEEHDGKISIKNYKIWLQEAGIDVSNEEASVTFEEVSEKEIRLDAERLKLVIRALCIKKSLKESECIDKLTWVPRGKRSSVSDTLKRFFRKSR